MRKLGRKRLPLTAKSEVWVELHDCDTLTTHADEHRNKLVRHTDHLPNPNENTAQQQQKCLAARPLGLAAGQAAQASGYQSIARLW